MPRVYYKQKYSPHKERLILGNHIGFRKTPLILFQMKLELHLKQSLKCFEHWRLLLQPVAAGTSLMRFHLRRIFWKIFYWWSIWVFCIYYLRFALLKNQSTKSNVDLLLFAFFPSCWESNNIKIIVDCTIALNRLPSFYSMHTLCWILKFAPLKG